MSRYSFIKQIILSGDDEGMWHAAAEYNITPMLGGTCILDKKGLYTPGEALAAVLIAAIDSAALLAKQQRDRYEIFKEDYKKAMGEWYVDEEEDKKKDSTSSKDGS
jgi:hypothetical protein